MSNQRTSPRDEAQRIGSNIAKLPELLGGPMPKNEA
jgi:hypothetical protein